MAEDHSLVVRPAEDADVYERRYMVGSERLLHHHKRRAPAWMQLLLMSTPAAGIGLLFAGEWLGAALLIALGVVVWGLFSVMRVTVTDQSLSIQYGLFGPKIPLRAITSVRAVDYHWARFGGWGIRGSAAGETMYNIPGDKGRAVRIEWTDARGRSRVVFVGMPEPAATVQAVETAIAALPAGVAAVAIDGDRAPPPALDAARRGGEPSGAASGSTE